MKGGLCLIMITSHCAGHYPSIEDRDMISCSVVNTNNITYNNLKALTDIPGKYPGWLQSDRSPPTHSVILNKGRIVVIVWNNFLERGFLCEYEAHCFALCQCCDFVACDCRMQVINNEKTRKHFVIWKISVYSMEVIFILLSRRNRNK